MFNAKDFPGEVVDTDQGSFYSDGTNVWQVDPSVDYSKVDPRDMWQYRADTSAANRQVMAQEQAPSMAGIKATGQGAMQGGKDMLRAVTELTPFTTSEEDRQANQRAAQEEAQAIEGMTPEDRRAFFLGKALPQIGVVGGATLATGGATVPAFLAGTAAQTLTTPSNQGMAQNMGFDMGTTYGNKGVQLIENALVGAAAGLFIKGGLSGVGWVAEKSQGLTNTAKVRAFKKAISDGTAKTAEQTIDDVLAQEGVPLRFKDLSPQAQAQLQEVYNTQMAIAKDADVSSLVAQAKQASLDVKPVLAQKAPGLAGTGTLSQDLADTPVSTQNASGGLVARRSDTLLEQRANEQAAAVQRGAQEFMTYEPSGKELMPKTVGEKLGNFAENLKSKAKQFMGAAYKEIDEISKTLPVDGKSSMEDLARIAEENSFNPEAQKSLARVAAALDPESTAKIESVLGEPVKVQNAYDLRNLQKQVRRAKRSATDDNLARVLGEIDGTLEKLQLEAGVPGLEELGRKSVAYYNLKNPKLNPTFAKLLDKREVSDTIVENMLKGDTAEIENVFDMLQNQIELVRGDEELVKLGTAAMGDVQNLVRNKLASKMVDGSRGAFRFDVSGFVKQLKTLDKNGKLDLILGKDELAKLEQFADKTRWLDLGQRAAQGAEVANLPPSRARDLAQIGLDRLRDKAGINFDVVPYTKYGLITKGIDFLRGGAAARQKLAQINLGDLPESELVKLGQSAEFRAWLSQNYPAVFGGVATENAKTQMTSR